MNKLLFSLLLACIMPALWSAAPPWFNRNSDQRYLVGNGTASLKNSDLPQAIALAKEDALQEISAQIYTQVRSMIDSREYADGATSQQFYAKEVQLSSCLSLCGYDVANSDKDRNHYYVQLQIPRNRMQEHYAQLVQQEITDIIAKKKAAQAATYSREAKKLYQQVRAKRDDLSRDLMILGFLQMRPDYADMLKEVPSVEEIEVEISRLSTNKAQSFEDLTTEIIEQITQSLKEPQTFSVGYYEWGNSGFASQFSSDFSAFLRACLERELGWQTPLSGSAPEVSVFGEMISEGKQICLFTRIISQNSPPQTLITYLNPVTIEHFGWDYLKPQDAAKEQQLRYIAQTDNSLKVDLRTGEFGKKLAVYAFGDKVSLEVRANKACWLHIYYLEADDTKTVLYENYKIAEDMVNQWIMVGTEFVACEPAGIEQAWVQAGLKKLPELFTSTVSLGGGGTKKILKENLQDALVRTRGIKIIEQANDYSEAFLTMTVVEK